MSTDETYDENEFGDDDGSDLGYSEFDWDKLPEAEVALHEAVLEMNQDELEALDIDAQTDLVKWAIAQSWAELDDLDRFQQIAMSLIQGAAEHPALDYGEIGIELVNDFVLEERFDEARETLARVAELVPDDPHVKPRFSAIIDVLAGNEDDGMATFQHLIESADDDAMLMLAIGEDLIAVDKSDAALDVLGRAEEIARQHGDDEVVQGIEDARAFIAEMRKA